MSDPFWRSARILLSYKRYIAVGMAGALLGAATFGVGLGMILPMLHLLLEKQRTLADLVQEYLAGPDRSAWSNDLAAWLTNWLPTDPFIGFILVMSLILVLSVVGSVGAYLRELMAITASLRASMLWRERMFHRLVHAPITFTLERGTGDQISRLLFDTRIIARGYLTLLGRAVGELLGGIAALIVAVTLNWRLTLVALVCLPVLAVLLRAFGRIISRATHRALHEQGRMAAALGETVGGLRVVKVHNAEDYEQQRFSGMNQAMLRAEMKARTAKAISSPLLKTLMHVGLTGLAVFAAWMTLEQGVPPKEFLTVLAALAGAAASVKPLSRLNNQLHESSAAAARVLDIAEMPIEERDEPASGERPPMPRHAKEIVFDNVSYAYPGSEEPALRGVSLSVLHGQTIAIVGGNGSGKTTLLSLLPRLLTPGAGRVLVDGVDVAHVHAHSLRAQIGVVTQETVLFQGTIAENIAYGRPSVERERVEAAARAAYAHDFIAALSGGYDTELGEGGTGLSGGQRQRLCIARALLRDPAIMILDEATSQIDADSEAKINQALRDLHRQRTTFVIAHRLSTVVDADRIVVMDAGRIVADGTHDELLTRSGVYRTLTQTQLKPLTGPRPVPVQCES